jgi:hypothetical protein
MASSGIPGRWEPREISIGPGELPDNFHELLEIMCGKYPEPQADDDGPRLQWFENAGDEALIAAVYGWHLRAMNTVTFLDRDLVDSLLCHRIHTRDHDADPDAAAELESLGVRGDDMMPGFLFTNAGIEEDTLARVYLRLIRVHFFASRFTGSDELDGVFNPDGVRAVLYRTRDELLTDTGNLLWVRQSLDDGSVCPLGEYPVEAERRIADEAEQIRRQFGYDEQFCAEHPGETTLRLRLAEMQSVSSVPTNNPIERVRRKRRHAMNDSFWTTERIQAALDLGLES